MLPEERNALSSCTKAVRMSPTQVRQLSKCSAGQRRRHQPEAHGRAVAALKKRKISQTVFTLDPCAMRPAHVHQRADGLLYVISGKLLRHLVP